LSEDGGEITTQKVDIKINGLFGNFVFKGDGSMATFFYQQLRSDNFMRSILYIIAVICIIGWLLGVFVWSATGIIHILIVLAVISLLFGIIRRA